MTLHLVYRSYGGENRKMRPYYYSKLLTLTSFARAVERLEDCDVIFLNDGPVPQDRLTVMHRFGRVVQLGLTAQGLRASYRAALNLAVDSDWPDSDVVLFIEDDYLFTDDALVALDRAATGLPEASYFSLYGDRPDYTDPNARVEHSLPRHWAPQPDVTVGDDVWFNRASIASTFAARLGALRADLSIFFACMRPFKKRFLDHETCLIYQGFVPYHGAELLLGLPEDFTPSARGVARTLVLTPFRVALNLKARQQRMAHHLYVLTPNLCTHVENPVVSTDRDWAEVASEVAGWAEANDLAGSAVVIRDTLSRTA